MGRPVVIIGCDIMSLTREELEQIKILSDPVLWAEATLRDPVDPSKPVTLRWYQEEILRDKSNRKVLRCGRRVGKTFTMAIHMLWYAFTHAGRPQIVVTPYESQISVIFEVLNAFIVNSPVLKDSLDKSNKSPYYYIRLKNGSVIKGFTAGTRSGANASSVRGQAGDYIYMDEVDYMSDADFETVYAVAADINTKGVWIASTPTGRRGKFWAACMNARIPEDEVDEKGNPRKVWTEFHYPSMVNPGWGPQMEADFRASLTEQGYIHEVLAEFGEETIGVIPKEYIDRARMVYNYMDKVDYPAIRIIGSDWDKYGAASQIVAMEYNEHYNKFMVINRVEIPKTKFTLDNAVKKIIELNEIYNPQYIYVDRGYGEYQVETLHKYGMDHPETGLHKKVVGVSFSESKSVVDPWTKISEKKPIKPFMVNQLALLFERDRIIINDNDELIIRQLENYRVVKRTVSGVPVFTSEDEHAIDCMMLCVLAFVEHFPGIIATVAEVKPSTKILPIRTVAENPLKKVVNKSISDMILEREKDYLKWDEPGSPPLKKVPVGSKPNRNLNIYSWSTRGTNLYKAHRRSTW